jgi:hypothetical protein
MRLTSVLEAKFQDTKKWMIAQLGENSKESFIIVPDDAAVRTVLNAKHELYKASKKLNGSNGQMQKVAKLFGKTLPTTDDFDAVDKVLNDTLIALSPMAKPLSNSETKAVLDELTEFGPEEWLKRLK